MSQRSHDNQGNDNKGNGDKGNNSPQHDEYDRSPLHDPVDWMTFSHEALYNMVHTGVNLEGAQAAATNCIRSSRTAVLAVSSDATNRNTIRSVPDMRPPRFRRRSEWRLPGTKIKKIFTTARKTAMPV